MHRRNLVIVATAIVLVAACGTAEPSAAPSIDTSPVASVVPSSPSASAAASGTAVDSIEGLAGAVFQVDSTGEFRSPDGSTTTAGGGSGFFIDPSGLAMTNSHVLAAQDSLRVRVGPDRIEHQAAVVAVAECSDLAVIKIDGGPFPYLDWYDGPIKVGLDVYAAGFPLGEPEFTLAGGIVSREHGLIDETWASVKNPIQHDANTNPGNSGGPIVTKDATVVAIHFAGERETRQAYAISREEALPILAELEAGNDVASLGINARALPIETEDGIVQGVLVGAVRPETPADKAGLAPGDVITEIDGVTFEPGDVMAQYCDVLRSHAASDVIDISVWRSDVAATLDAQINGEPVDPGFSFAEELSDLVATGPDVVTFSDEFAASGPVTFDTPDDWLDKDERAWTFDGDAVGPGLIVSTSVNDFTGGYTTAGAFAAASYDTLDRTDDEILDIEGKKFEDDCAYVDRRDFTRGAYSGRFDVWTGCNEADSVFLVIAGAPEADHLTSYVQFQATTTADLLALDRLFDTLMLSP